MLGVADQEGRPWPELGAIERLSWPGWQCSACSCARLGAEGSEDAGRVQHCSKLEELVPEDGGYRASCRPSQPLPRHGADLSRSAPEPELQARLQRLQEEHGEEEEPRGAARGPRGRARGLTLPEQQLGQPASGLRSRSVPHTLQAQAESQPEHSEITQSSGKGGADGEELSSQSAGLLELDFPGRPGERLAAELRVRSRPLRQVADASQTQRAQRGCPRVRGPRAGPERIAEQARC